MKIKTMYDDHVNEALTQYCHMMSIINKNEVVVKTRRVAEGLELIVEKEKNND